MGDYLMRGDAPLTEGEWAQVDGIVVDVARKLLVGRRVLDLAGPFGAGLEVIPVGTGAGRAQIPLTVIEEDFALNWREVEASRQMGVPLELGTAAKAAMACAKAEDLLILDGLAAAAGNSVAVGDWSEPGVPLSDVVKATEKLFAADCFGPYAVVLSPDLYAATQRVSRGMGRMVSKLMAGVAEGGLYRSALLGAGTGLVLALGAYNFDLVVGQDLITAYQGNEGLDHGFRVLETVALRVKRPAAICKLG